MSTTRSESMTANVQIAFPQFVAPPAEPVGLLREWLDDATRHQVREPRALALATADAQGRCSTRIVVINQVTAAGCVFLTHQDSRKGRELAENPWASGVLYWRETSQQISFSGPVQKLPDAATEELWNARPAFTHAMTTASRQSAPLEGQDEVEALRRRALKLGAGGTKLALPETFAAYELRFDSVEFWANGTDRLHERLRYERATAGWHVERLQP